MMDGWMEGGRAGKGSGVHAWALLLGRIYVELMGACMLML